MRSLKHWRLCTGGQSATDAVTYTKTNFCITSEQNLPQSNAVRGNRIQAPPHSDVHILDQGGSCRQQGRGMGVCHDGLVVSFLAWLLLWLCSTRTTPIVCPAVPML